MIIQIVSFPRIFVIEKPTIFTVIYFKVTLIRVQDISINKFLNIWTLDIHKVWPVWQQGSMTFNKIQCVSMSSKRFSVSQKCSARFNKVQLDSKRFNEVQWGSISFNKVLQGYKRFNKVKRDLKRFKKVWRGSTRYNQVQLGSTRFNSFKYHRMPRFQRAVISDAKFKSSTILKQIV